MIWIHTSAYFLGNPVSRFVWDTQEWVVHTFIFCSVYLALGKVKKDISWLQILKRIWRILWPYYVFLVALLTLHFIAGSKTANVNFAFSSLFMYGGTDFNWLPMLFIQLAIIVPIFLLAVKKNGKVLYVVLSICLLFSLVYFWRDLKPYYRFIMLPPWFLVILFGYIYRTCTHKLRTLLITLAISLGISICCYFLLRWSHVETLQYYHKYPPDLYHIAIGISGLCVAVLFYKLLGKYLDVLKPVYTFLSKYSYSLFFVHVLVMNFITLYYGHWKLHWWEFLLWTLFGSLLVQFGIILVQSTLQTTRRLKV